MSSEDIADLDGYEFHDGANFEQENDDEFNAEKLGLWADALHGSTRLIFLFYFIFGTGDSKVTTFAFIFLIPDATLT
jgi:hypothetical protein